MSMSFYIFPIIVNVRTSNAVGRDYQVETDPSYYSRSIAILLVYSDFGCGDKSNASKTIHTLCTCKFETVNMWNCPTRLKLIFDWNKSAGNSNDYSHVKITYLWMTTCPAKIASTWLIDSVLWSTTGSDRAREMRERDRVIGTRFLS